MAPPRQRRVRPGHPNRPPRRRLRRPVPDLVRDAPSPQPGVCGTHQRAVWRGRHDNRRLSRPLKGCPSTHSPSRSLTFSACATRSRLSACVACRSTSARRSSTPAHMAFINYANSALTLMELQVDVKRREAALADVGRRRSNQLPATRSTQYARCSTSRQIRQTRAARP